ncbi:hypothetical protein PF003_g23429 [Phytophthora fragariae]|nr:hypothetical protein PF003_g23429 [Phytophthora fragariae]
MDVTNMACNSGRGLCMTVAQKSGRGRIPFSRQLRTITVCRTSSNPARQCLRTCEASPAAAKQPLEMHIFMQM